VKEKGLNYDDEITAPASGLPTLLSFFLKYMYFEPLGSKYAQAGAWSGVPADPI
jgi:hypothetical protein